MTSTATGTSGERSRENERIAEEQYAERSATWNEAARQAAAAARSRSVSASGQTKPSTWSRIHDAHEGSPEGSPPREEGSEQERTET